MFLIHSLSSIDNNNNNKTKFKTLSQNHVSTPDSKNTITIHFLLHSMSSKQPKTKLHFALFFPHDNFCTKQKECRIEKNKKTFPIPQSHQPTNVVLKSICQKQGGIDTKLKQHKTKKTKQAKIVFW